MNVAKLDRNESDSSEFSFSITPTGCYSDASEWLLDMGLPIIYVPEGNDFLSLRS